MIIGCIGLGTMGAPIAAHLIRAGYTVRVYNRTAHKMDPLTELGATPTNSPAECATGVDVLITNVSDSADVSEVLLGEHGAITTLAAGATVIDLSTISPAVTRQVAQTLNSNGVTMLDAPVSGGSEGAKNGTLSVMVGGDRAVFDRVAPIFSVFAQTVTYVGESGAGQTTKAINQILISGTYAAVAEGVALGLASGLDMDAVLQAVGGGAAASWVLANRATNMVDNEYPLGFRTRLHRKDLAIALDAALEVGVSLPVTAYVAQLETSLIKRGFGDEDMSNIARIVREQAGLS